MSDQPGVLAQIANITGSHEVGILSVIQPEPDEPTDDVPLILLLHDAKYGTVQDALKEIVELDAVSDDHTLLRVESLQS